MSEVNPYPDDPGFLDALKAEIGERREMTQAEFERRMLEVRRTRVAMRQRREAGLIARKAAKEARARAEAPVAFARVRGQQRVLLSCPLCGGEHEQRDTGGWARPACKPTALVKVVKVGDDEDAFDALLRRIA